MWSPKQRSKTSSIAAGAMEAPGGCAEETCDRTIQVGDQIGAEFQLAEGRTDNRFNYLDALACGNKFPIFFLGIGHVFSEGFKLGFFVFEQLSDEVFW